MSEIRHPSPCCDYYNSTYSREKSNADVMMLQRFRNWLGTKLLDGNSPAAKPEPKPVSVRVRPSVVRPRPAKPELVKFRAEMDGRIADGGPGKNVLLESKCVREGKDSHDSLKILDYSLEEDEEGGIDPYNTGSFNRSIHWERRFRK